MGRCLSFLLLLGVALKVAGPANGDMSAAFAGTGAAYSIDGAVRQLMSPPLMKLEDGVDPELSIDLEVHRRVLAGISPGALSRNRPACPGACPAPGGSYTNRGCQKKYQCRG
ncbi:hypothetical protein CFC21_017133 [Triticum aestivum]|uniref:Uncharacterized protein n=2 Tax=Triticum aestivum TaxID=4565 RepID=A0A9R1J2A2_WHEAT|nr:uncharacterized protein LOC123185408 [Triticum aestivum]KAF7001464.1 hypothetical protein CFC21_017131 [Triticum aestivum]KAF7001466.1 hypothetical protein CFC21_017133 [Triticum aestivum]